MRFSPALFVALAATAMAAPLEVMGRDLEMRELAKREAGGSDGNAIYHGKREAEAGGPGDRNAIYYNKREAEAGGPGDRNAIYYNKREAEAGGGNRNAVE